MLLTPEPTDVLEPKAGDIEKLASAKFIHFVREIYDWDDETAQLPPIPMWYHGPELRVVAWGRAGFVTAIWKKNAGKIVMIAHMLTAGRREWNTYVLCAQKMVCFSAPRSASTPISTTTMAFNVVDGRNVSDYPNSLT